MADRAGPACRDDLLEPTQTDLFDGRLPRVLLRRTSDRAPCEPVFEPTIAVMRSGRGSAGGAARHAFRDATRSAASLCVAALRPVCGAPVSAGSRLLRVVPHRGHDGSDRALRPRRRRSVALAVSRVRGDHGQRDLLRRATGAVRVAGLRGSCACRAASALERGGSLYADHDDGAASGTSGSGRDVDRAAANTPARRPGNGFARGPWGRGRRPIHCHHLRQPGHPGARARQCVRMAVQPDIAFDVVWNRSCFRGPLRGTHVRADADRRRRGRDAAPARDR